MGYVIRYTFVTKEQEINMLKVREKIEEGKKTAELGCGSSHTFFIYHYNILTLSQKK